MEERKLTPKQQAFVLAYLETGNATESYRRAYDVSRMKEATVQNNAYMLLKHGAISASVERARKLSVDRATIDRAELLEMFADIATADSNDLSELQVQNCRHCWGTNFKYRWHSTHEYARICAEIMDRNDAEERRWQRDVDMGSKAPRPEPQPVPTDEGGYGFRPGHHPNDECPYCLGVGITEVVFKDTRKLGRKARRLYAGVKRTRDGLEIKTASQEHAREVLRKELRIGTEAEKQAAVAVGINAPGGQVQAVTIIADPLEAARQYQELMK